MSEKCLFGGGLGEFCNEQRMKGNTGTQEGYDKETPFCILENNDADTYFHEIRDLLCFYKKEELINTLELASKRFERETGCRNREHMITIIQQRLSELRQG